MREEQISLCNLPHPPFESSSTGAAGDLSRFVLFEELDLECWGLFCETRAGGSEGVFECELDLDVVGFFCEIRGNSVGVSEYPSDARLSLSGDNALRSTGSDGRDLSSSMLLPW